jgi:cell division protein ZapA (FtsZ GTPase activity inhibitor)
MAETTHITVIIAGRSYPLIVEKAEEQVVLQTVRTINERITQLQAQFQSKDKQDCLAMTLLELAIGNNDDKPVQKPSPKPDNQEIQQALNDLERSIDQLLA